MISRFQTLIRDMVAFWFKGAEILENHRPDWLGGLELDIYVPKFSFGVEVNGVQHYEQAFDGHSLSEQKERDRCKRILCERRNVHLHIVREFHFRKKPGREITQQLKTSIAHALGVKKKLLPHAPQKMVEAIAHHMAVLRDLSLRNGIILKREFNSVSTDIEQINHFFK